MFISKFFLALIPALAAANYGSLDNEYSLNTRSIDVDEYDGDVFDLSARDLGDDEYEPLSIRDLDDDELIDLLVARTWPAGGSGIYGDSSGSHTATVSTGGPYIPNFSYPRGHPKNGGGIQQTKSWSVTSAPRKRSLERRTWPAGGSGIYGDSSGSHTATVSTGAPYVPNFSYPRGHPKNGGGIQQTKSWSVTSAPRRRSLERRTWPAGGSGIYGDSSSSHTATVSTGAPYVPNFSYPRGHPKNGGGIQQTKSWSVTSAPRRRSI